MNEQNETKHVLEGDHQTREPQETKPGTEGLRRRSFLRGSALAGATLASLSAHAQSRANVAKAEKDHSASDPGPENKPLLDLNPDSNLPPPTDFGDVGSDWYSFDLTQKRIQPGGWTHQVTQTVLPSSTEIAGVQMRLTAGSFRELHWHTSDEWAYMLTGNARVTLLDPKGKVFIGDVGEADLWYFPAGHPHSIQGLGPDGCEFLLIFDQGNFSDYNTLLLTQWLAHTPLSVLSKNFELPESALSALTKLPPGGRYIFPAALPRSLAEDKQSVGGPQVETREAYTFKMGAMTPTLQTKGGEVWVVDSHNFLVSKNIAAARNNIKPGGVKCTGIRMPMNGCIL